MSLFSKALLRLQQHFHNQPVQQMIRCNGQVMMASVRLTGWNRQQNRFDTMTWHIKCATPIRTQCWPQVRSQRMMREPP